MHFKGHIIVVIVMTLLEITLTTARVTNSFHQTPTQNNEMNKSPSLKDKRTWNPQQPFANIVDYDLKKEVEDEAGMSEDSFSRDTDIDVDVVDTLADDEKSKSSGGTVNKPWLEMEGAPDTTEPVKLHSDITLECQAVGSPPPMIYWLKNGKRIDNVLTHRSEEQWSNQVDEYETSTGRNGNGFVMAKIKSKLVIRCVRPEDEAQYTCIADNNGRQVEAKTYVSITVDDLSDVVRPECERRLESFAFRKKHRTPFSAPFILAAETLHMEPIGNNVVLPCRVAGFPVPTITWLDADGITIVPGKKYQVSPSGSLLIRNLSWKEMGEYTCEATNKFGSEVATTFLYPLMKEDDSKR